MSIGKMKAAICKIRDVVSEWDKVGETDWLEDHTRYSVVDPVIQALGWDTADPKVCHSEFPRPFPAGRVDYALFGAADVYSIVNDGLPPDVIIEAKALRTSLKEAVPQLRRYAWASPGMQRGRAVLTSGNQWWVYDLGLPGAFTARRVVQVDILKDDPQVSAQVLDLWLCRLGFG